jgi:hypothetical protein
LKQSESARKIRSNWRAAALVPVSNTLWLRFLRVGDIPDPDLLVLAAAGQLLAVLAEDRVVDIEGDMDRMAPSIN